MITIVIPVYNEELILKGNTLKLFAFCQKNIKSDWQIIISDNNSTDRTPLIARSLAEEFPQIRYFKSPEIGKGSAVINAWQHFKSDIYVFMDSDLATDIKSLPQLISSITSGFDIVIGSRYLKDSKLDRSLFRKTFSFGLRMILKLFFRLKVKDTPCGFKAVNHRAVHQILPLIQNRTWFFDTELLILAQKRGLSIKEIPVNWQEITHPDRQSKVGIIKVIIDYLKSIYSVYRRI